MPAAERLEIEHLEQGFRRVRALRLHAEPNVPVALRLASETGLEIDLDDVTYFLGRETVGPDRRGPGHGALARAAVRLPVSGTPLSATTFYNLPPERVIELGIQVQMSDRLSGEGAGCRGEGGSPGPQRFPHRAA